MERNRAVLRYQAYSYFYRSRAFVALSLRASHPGLVWAMVSANPLGFVVQFGGTS
jgi:hypothetical protein